MNDDYAEEFGMASEAQNCYAEAQMERARRDQTAQAKYWTAKGKSVVCQYVTYYCRATDALVGDYLSIRRICEDRETAEFIAASVPGDPDEGGGYFVYNLPAPAPAPAPVVDDDQCPF
jgi:hypothetical protein